MVTVKIYTNWSVQLKWALFNYKKFPHGRLSAELMYGPWETDVSLSDIHMCMYTCHYGLIAAGILLERLKEVS